MKKRFFKKFVLICLGCIIAFFILETFFHFFSLETLQGGFRILLGDSLRDCQERGKILHHQLKPNCQGTIKIKEYTINLKTNSLGLRDKEVSLSKDQNTYRVLLVGDSFTEGWGVEYEERFDVLAKDLLDNNNDVKVEIINAGVRSYSPILELEYLYEKGIKLKPDLVIMFYDFSDLHDDYYYGGWQRHKIMKDKIFKGKQDYFKPWPDDKESNLIKLLRKSDFLNTLYAQLMMKLMNNQRKFSQLSLQTDISLYARAQDWPDFSKAFSLNIANIALIKDFLREEGIGFVLAIIPRGNYVSKDEWHQGRKTLNIKENVLYEPKPITILEDGVAEFGITTLSLLNPLIESNKFPLYYSFDGHWTKDGHRVVGAALAEYIKSNH
jgi:hypothetical protein